MENSNDGEPKLEFESIRKHATEYLKNRLEYFKLVIIEYFARLAPSIVLLLVIGMIMLVFWVFANISAALAIGNALQNPSMGFLIVSGINLVLALFIFAARKALIFKPVSNWLVQILLKSMDADENN